MSAIPNGRCTIGGVNRGHTIPSMLYRSSFGISRWPTDAIGTTSVRFSGVMAGSEIRVYLPDKTEAAGVESCVADQLLTWDVFAAGSPFNTVRIVIISIDSTIQDFSYESVQGSQTIPIFQEEDPWFKDPV